MPEEPMPISFFIAKQQVNGKLTARKTLIDKEDGNYRSENSKKRWN
jgi:hypothetical protein